MNLVRSLNKYHGGIADRIAIMARSANIGAQTEHSGHPSTGFYYGLRTLWFDAHILAIELINWIMKKISGQYIEEII